MLVHHVRQLLDATATLWSRRRRQTFELVIKR